MPTLGVPAALAQDVALPQDNSTGTVVAAEAAVGGSPNDLADFFLAGTQGGSEAKSAVDFRSADWRAPKFFGLQEVHVAASSLIDLQGPEFFPAAVDYEDGGLTDAVELLSDNVAQGVPGDYQRQYQVIDSHGNVTEHVVHFTIYSDADWETYKQDFAKQHFELDADTALVAYRTPEDRVTTWDLDTLDYAQANLTEEDLQNRPANKELKAQAVFAFQQLDIAARQPYVSLYNTILRGGLPTITVADTTVVIPSATSTPTFDPSWVAVHDNEDGAYANGNVPVTEEQLTLSPAIEDWTIGENLVTFTYVDAEGNQASTKAIMTVEIAPAPLPIEEEQAAEIPTIPADQGSVLEPQVEEEPEAPERPEPAQVDNEPVEQTAPQPPVQPSAPADIAPSQPAPAVSAPTIELVSMVETAEGIVINAPVPVSETTGENPAGDTAEAKEQAVDQPAADQPADATSPGDYVVADEVALEPNNPTAFLGVIGALAIVGLAMAVGPGLMQLLRKP